MQERPRALVFDLDGTLLGRDGCVSARNRDALRALEGADIDLIAATGRCYCECRRVLKEIEHVGPVIAAGGSLLCDRQGHTLHRKLLVDAVVAATTEVLLERDLRVLVLKDGDACGLDYVLVGDAPLHPASIWWFADHGVRLAEVPTISDDPCPGQTIRVGAVADAGCLAEPAQVLAASLGDQARIQHWPAVTSSEATGSATHLLEIFEPTVNKWSMLRRVLPETFSAGAIVAIGDGLNDLELLEEAGLSIAMGNADSDLQAKADVIAGDHDDDGFADAIIRHVLNAAVDA